jgi:low affinity Fe/Cu permease
VVRRGHPGDLGQDAGVIQRAEHRGTQALHATKLDEILHVMGDARNELTRVDEEEPEEIENRRSRMRKGRRRRAPLGR